MLPLHGDMGTLRQLRLDVESPLQLLGSLLRDVVRAAKCICQHRRNLIKDCYTRAPRPVKRLNTTRTRTTRRIMWINPPPKCNKKPSSHKTKSTEMIVQSIPAMCYSYPFPRYFNHVSLRRRGCRRVVRGVVCNASELISISPAVFRR